MKFCDISSFYLEEGGGVHTYHLQKLAYFAKHPEHEYHMVISGKSNSSRQVEGGTVHTVKGFVSVPGTEYRQMYDYPEIQRILKKHEPDVVEIGAHYLDGWMALFGRRKWTPLMTGIYHADMPDSYMAPAVEGFPRWISRPFVGFWRQYVRMAYQKLDATWVTSDYMLKKLNKYGVKNTFKNSLGVDTEKFQPAKRSEALRTELGVKAGEKLALFVGRFSWEKGMVSLIDSLDHLAEEENLRVVIVGDGPLKKDLAPKVAEHTSFVTLLPYEKDRDRLAAMYASADIFLAPGPYETFGLTTLEAMSSGTAVVAAASGGSAELVTRGNCGVLFKNHSGEEMARGVKELLHTDTRDLERRARLVVEKEFSWTRTFDRMVDCYKERVDAKRSCPSIPSRRNTRSVRRVEKDPSFATKMGTA